LADRRSRESEEKEAGTAPTANNPSDRPDDSVGIARDLVIAGTLASLAGMVDAIGYLHLGGLFISFMSGNSTQLAAALGQARLAEGGAIAELIALFVLGAAAGQIVAALTGFRHMTWVLIGVTLMLVIAAVSAAAPEPMVLAMGALNASMHRAGNIPVSLTFVTGVLVRFGQGLGDFLIRRSRGWRWLAQASPWLGLISGATLGAAIYGLMGQAAIWIAVAFSAVLAAISAAISQPD
jgi:uncharacterized membrane protein YoaK (UPF0700 family)